MHLKVNARLLQQVDRIWSIHIVAVNTLSSICRRLHHDETVNALYAESKIELPGCVFERKVALLIRQSDSNLNNLEKVDIAAHGLVVIVRRCLKVAYWTRHYPRKLCILEVTVKFPTSAERREAETIAI